MLAKIPIDLNGIKKEDLDKEILRLGISAELDAISLYEQLADKTANENIKKVMLNIAKEEKTHIGEFQTLLLEIDAEQKTELENGAKEVQKTVKESLHDLVEMANKNMAQWRIE